MKLQIFLSQQSTTACIPFTLEVYQQDDDSALFESIARAHPYDGLEMTTNFDVQEVLEIRVDTKKVIDRWVRVERKSQVHGHNE